MVVAIQKDTFPVSVTVQIRKNVFSGEVYFDDKVNITFFHEVTEDEDYYIRTILKELITRYQGKGKYFLLLDLRKLPQAGMTILPLDKLDELYTFTKPTNHDSFFVKTSE